MTNLFPFLNMECLSEAVIIGFVSFIFFYWFIYMRRKGKKLKLPPGPRPWPFIGNLNLLGNLPHQSLMTLAKRYGPIMFLRLGSIPTVVVSSSSMAKEFLKTYDSVFASRPNFSYGKYVAYDHKGVAFSPYGDYWRQMRKLMTMELLTVKRIDSFSVVIEEEMSAMINSIWLESGQGAKYVDIKKWVSSLTQNIVCRMFASRTYSDSELSGGLGFKQMVEEIFSVAGAFPIGDLIPSLDWLDFQGFRRRMKAVHSIFDAFAEKVIDEHIHRRLENGKTKEEEHVKDMVDVMLTMAETDGHKISRLDIKAMILDAVNGGMETSVTLLEWAMSELLKNPETLTRAQKEIDSAVGRNRRVNENDVRSLEYLKCVVKETLRLHSPVPLLAPHESMEGCSVGGYFVPPKTRVLVNVWAIGRDEKVWRDADQFKPERFMGYDKDFRGQEFDMLPFGAGRRGCPGIYLGLSMSELALANLVHCFDWTVDGEVDMAEEFGLTVPRKNPLLVCPKWRLATEYST